MASVLKKIRRLALEKRIVFTHKVAQEVEALALGIDFDDVCDVIASLNKEDFYERIPSAVTQEWLYLFKPTVGGSVLYVKVILREDCIVISFHEDEDDT